MNAKGKDIWKAIARSFAFLLAAFGYVACFWQLTTPTHLLEIGFDTACFYVIGNGILHGKIPYIDYIDNKGPVTYLIFAFAARVGRYPWGILVVGTFFVAASLLGLYVMCRRLGIRRYYILQFLFLSFYALICTDGGVTEDLAIPFCIWSFAILADFWEKSKQDIFRFRYGLCIGVLFWLCAQTRINNAVPIAAAAVCIGLHLLFKKEFRRFGVLILSFLAGSAAVLTPSVVYLLKHHALRECLNQVLLNNFKYGDASTALSLRELFFSGAFAFRFHLIVAVSLFCLLICFGSHRTDCAFLRRSAWLITGITLLSCLSFTHLIQHYLLCLLPALIFCLSMPFVFLSDKKNVKGFRTRIAAGALCFLVSFFCMGGPEKIRKGFWYAVDISVYALRPNAVRTQEAWRDRWDQMIGQIPEAERDSVFAVDITPKWFIYSDMEPCKRMFVRAELFTSISPEYAQEFRSYFQDDPPKWLILSDSLDVSSIPGFSEILAEKYRHVDTYDVEDAGQILHLYHLEVDENA